MLHPPFSTHVPYAAIEILFMALAYGIEVGNLATPPSFIRRGREGGYSS